VGQLKSGYGPTPPKSATAVAGLGPEEARRKRKAQQRLQKNQWQKKYKKKYSEGGTTRGGGGEGSDGFHVGEKLEEEDGLISDGEMRPCLMQYCLSLDFSRKLQSFGCTVRKSLTPK